MTMISAAILGLALAAGGAVPEQRRPMQAESPAACPTPVVSTPAYASFADPVVVASGGRLTLGRAARVTLVAKASYAIPPAKAPMPGDLGAAVTFVVKTAGRYRVALGTGAWVDVVAGGRMLTSVAHGHGPACSPVRKMVDFDLQPGTYTLQLSGTRAATAAVQVAPAG